MASYRQGGGEAAPHRSTIALLIIDMISDFEFEGGQGLFRHALPAARNIVRLKARARAARIPTIAGQLRVLLDSLADSVATDRG